MKFSPRAVRYMVETADAGSVTEAAKRLNGIPTVDFGCEAFAIGGLFGPGSIAPPGVDAT
jgi:hypothetical protein